MQPLIIGHRGAAGLEPENTLQSFRRALSIGVDAVETDVRLTSDGIPVCFHDETLQRIAQRPEPISAFTLEELRGLDIGQGEHIPTLLETLRVVRGHAKLEIEFKTPDSVEAALAVLEREGIAPAEVILTSFDSGALSSAHRLRPDLPISILYTLYPEDWLETAHAVGAAAVNIYHLAVSADWVRKVHNAGMKARTWTVNNPDDMQRLIKLGMDGITTDRPDVLREQLYRSSSNALP